IQDLQRQKLEFPVICGGAALTRKYVEDDLRREYENAVFYAEDAFAGLHVMEDLVTEDGAREARLRDGRTVKEYAKAAAVDEETGPVFSERSAVVTDAPNIPEPPFWGVRVKSYDVLEVFPYINETALFKNQWQLKTASQADYVRLVEEKFRPIEKKLEEEVAESGLFESKVVYGYFPCQSEGNDVVVYEVPGIESRVVSADATGKTAGFSTSLGITKPVEQKELLRFTFPRQREGRRLCISDFFASKATGKMDVIGFSLVTIGAKASVETQRLFEGGEYTKYLYLHGLSVETAEALAELHHKKMREELGIAGEDAPAIRDLFHQKYRGSRYSFGYPACPNLEDQTKLFVLLKPEENVGVRLTSGFLLEPEQSTSALVVHHPAAKYFVV
ncbi:MAG: vitamin B12 dependent-methionine synthase activation domain-containing protein, partial [Candidatus Sulfotelmatobacter sp.]